MIDNPYAYGTGEHMAFEVQTRFGFQPAAFCIWLMTKDMYRTSITKFLGEVLDNQGIEIAGYLANYLQSFETMPPITEETKEKITLLLLDFNENEDPDLKRFKDWEDYE